jgi:hypothetical protein
MPDARIRSGRVEILVLLPVAVEAFRARDCSGTLIAAAQVMPVPLPNLLPVGWRGDAITRNTGATASKSHRFLAKVPAPRRRVPSVLGFRKMRV